MVLGLDIGGANIKFASHDGPAGSVPFALWRAPQELTQCLRQLLRTLMPVDSVAVTMTGELCDCFRSKEHGVRHIVSCVQEALRDQSESPTLRIWTTAGSWCTPEEAISTPLPVAAANWLALAHYAGHYARTGTAVLCDVGSTTTDLVPVESGVPVPQGLDDTTRLLAGELVYMGARRTPVATLVDHLPYRGQSCPVAREVFSTSHDVSLILGHAPEAPEDIDTADGRPATRDGARERLARMLCLNPAEFSMDDAVSAATAVHQAQLGLLSTASARIAARLKSPITTIILSGSGECLARDWVSQVAPSKETQIVSLNTQLGPDRATAACAYAVAMLAASKFANRTQPV